MRKRRNDEEETMKGKGRGGMEETEGGGEREGTMGKGKGGRGGG